MDLVLETTATTEPNVTRLALTLYYVPNSTGGTSGSTTFVGASVVDTEEDLFSIDVRIDAIGSSTTVGIPAVMPMRTKAMISVEGETR